MFTGDGMQERGVTLCENLPLVPGDLFGVGLKGGEQRIATGCGVEKELANVGNIVNVRPPSGPKLIEQAASFALGIHGAENGFASADVVVELASDIQRIVVDQQNIIGFVYRGQGFVLRQVTLQLHDVTQPEKGFAEAWLFDMADKAEFESGLDLRWQRLQGFNQRCGFG